MHVGERFFQALLIVSTLALSWLGMMAAHELGHVAHLWLSSGTVEYVLLHPARLSYTQPGRNPWPLFVAAGGAVWGCGLPLAAWLIIRRLAPRRAYLARFFAGFCLVANGAYLGADAFIAGGDARELMAHGTPSWLLAALGLPAVGWGLYLWHGQGENFGLGGAKGKVDRRAAAGVAVVLAVVVALELALSTPIR
jgi:hypothetical protein